MDKSDRLYAAMFIQGIAADLAAEAAETEGPLGMILKREADRLIGLGREIERERASLPAQKSHARETA